MSQRAPFQRFLRGEDDAMSDKEVRGALSFFGSADCVACHTGPALNSMNFFSMGFEDMDQRKAKGDLLDRQLVVKENDPANQGRAEFTKNELEAFAFKVPQLYNLRDHAAFGHGLSYTTLREVVDHMNNGRSANNRVDTAGTLLNSKGMSDDECSDLTSFIEDALHDPELHRFVPETVPSGKCGINGDPQSLNDLDCKQ